jgi:hypothetical protein
MKDQPYNPTYVTNFVPPDPDPMPPAPLLPAPLPDLPALDVDPAALYSRGPQIRAVETTTPMTEAAAFLVKYLGLSIVLAILATGLAWQMQWHASLGLIAFAVLAIAGYWCLAALDHGYTAPGVERHRLTQGTRVLLRQIDAQRDIELERLHIERARLAYQQQVNATLAARYHYKADRQLARHAQPDPATPTPRRTPPNPDPDNPAPPDQRAHPPPDHPHPDPWDHLPDHLPPDYRGQGLPDPARAIDPARAAILDGLRDAYLAADGDGWVNRHHVLPWSLRAAGSRSQRARMRHLIEASGIAAFDPATRLWRLDRRRYPTPHAAADALAGVL